MDGKKEFIADTRKEALMLMEKGLRDMRPKELDMFIALCDAHRGACEIIEVSEVVERPDVSVYKDIADELKAAEKYCAIWEESGEATYKSIAKEELRHAEQLIALAQKNADAPESEQELQGLISRYRALAAKLV